nr:hypothetical protein [Butyricicoccus sp. OM06-6AC]
MTDIAPDDMAQEVQDKWYGDHDYHTMYIGEIVALTRTDFTENSPIPHGFGVLSRKEVQGRSAALYPNPQTHASKGRNAIREKTIAQSDHSGCADGRHAACGFCGL